MKIGKSLLFLTPVFIMGLLLAMPVVVGQQESYKIENMPKLMDATWKEDVIGVGTDPAAIRSLLQRGQLIIINERPTRVKWLITGAMLANARPETVFSVISDYDNYIRFMPQTEKAWAEELNGPNIVNLHINLNVKIIKGISVSVKYAIIHYHRPPYRSDWMMHSGRFEENVGFYQFVPVDGGKRTMIFYTLYSLPRIPLATSMFKKDPNLELTLIIGTATMVVRALKKRAEEVEGTEPFIPGKGMGGNTVDVMMKSPKTINLLLKRGGLILIEDGPPMWVTTVAAINAPPAEVYRAVASFDKYNCYQSQIVRSEVIEKAGNNASVFFHLNMDYALFKIALKYTLDYELNPPTGMSWKWVDGDVPSQQGSWTFMPLEGGRRTLAFFRTTEDLKTLPGLVGAAVRATIKAEGTFEPAILASQALLVTRSTRDLMNKPAPKRKEILESCPK